MSAAPSVEPAPAAADEPAVPEGAALADEDAGAVGAAVGQRGRHGPHGSLIFGTQPARPDDPGDPAHGGTLT